MASTSKEPFSVEVNMILTPVKTSEDDGSTTPEDDDIMQITPIAYFPKGQRMFSGSQDKTTRQWDLQAGKEIEEARDVCEEEVWAAAVSRDGRWVVTGGGDDERSELKACEVETGIVKRFQGHSQRITCIDISADNVLLASGSFDETARIWNLETGKLVAGPFKSDDDAGAVRFSPDSKKLAVKSWTGDWIEVWDVQSQKLDVRVGEYNCPVHAEPAGPVTVYGTFSPVFWTNKNKTIIAAFSFTDDDATTIYEFDASTLKTIGTPFKGHTDLVTAFALLFDGAFLVSASDDFTVKLWAFESRQLIASFDAAGSVQTLISSPDSLQLAHTFYTDPNIYISNATAALLAIPEVQSTLPKSNATLQHLLNSDATRRPAVVRRTPAKRSIIISSTPRRHIHSPTIDPQQHTFLRHVRKLFHFSSRTNVVPPVQHRDPLDFPATSPLPPIRSASSQAATQLDHVGLQL